MRSLVRDAYQPYVERIGREPAPMTADYDVIASSGRATLAYVGVELRGLLVIEMNEAALQVENLAVHPRAHGTGVGSLLLRHAEHLAIAAGCKEIRLYTNEAMFENLTFYPRRGFTETHGRSEDGFRRVFFCKPLHGPNTVRVR